MDTPSHAAWATKKIRLTESVAPLKPSISTKDQAPRPWVRSIYAKKLNVQARLDVTPITVVRRALTSNSKQTQLDTTKFRVRFRWH